MTQKIRETIQSLTMGQSLKARGFRGGAWLGSASFAEQLVRFGRNMILARLLMPEAFGAMAIVLSAGSVIQSFTDIGVKEGLIQNPKGGEPQYAQAAWWLMVGRAVSLYSILFIVAPLVAGFYGDPDLSLLLRVAATGVLFDGTISARAYLAIKQMKLSRWAAVNHGGAICGVLVTIILALYVRSVWALAIGFVSESAARCTLSYLLCPFVPTFQWKGGAARELLKFSRGVFGLSFLNLIFSRTDIFVLAKLYPAAELGLYALAVYLVQTPTTFLMNVLGQTLLPTFSQVSEDNERLHRNVLLVTGTLLLLGIPAIAFIAFFGHSILVLVYGKAYGTAAGALFAASLVSLMNVANGQITLIFYAKGRPGLHRRCVILMALVMAVLIYPLVSFTGMVGGQLAALAAILAGYSFQVARLHRLTGLAVSRVARVYFIPVMASLGTVALCAGSRTLSTGTEPSASIMLGILGVMVSYCLGLFMMTRGRGSQADTWTAARG